MSERVLREVFTRYEAESQAEYLLALYLAHEADEKGERIWPTVDMMASATKVTPRSVWRALAAMKRSGWLQEVAPAFPGIGKVYRIDPVWIAGAHAEVSVDPYPVGRTRAPMKGRVR